MKPYSEPALREIPSPGASSVLVDRCYVEQLLRDSRSLWHTLFAQSRDGVVVLDQNGKVYDANQRFADTLGYCLEEVYNLHVWDWAYGLDADELRGMLRAIDEAGHHFETQQMRKDGSLVDIELSNSCTMFGGQKLIFCICRDITERKAAEGRIRYLATTDTLTCAANRAEFSRLLNEAIAHAHASGDGLGLVMFDLDHFKRINDTYGHDIGDAVLKGVMEVVRECTREGDLIGRWGGEEFMLLLPNADLAKAQRAAERVRQGIEAHHFAPADRVTASFGVVTLAPGERFDVLLKRVDVALYRAKTAGRNRVATQDVQ